MDRTNLRILDRLQRDARLSIADLARSLDRAESTVRERVAALEGRGVIQGYRTVVDRAKLDLGTHAVLRARCDLRRLDDVVARLAAVPQVTRILVTSGGLPLHVEVVARDLHELDLLLARRIAPLELEELETSIVVRAPLEERPLRLVAEPGTPIVRVLGPPDGPPPEEHLESPEGVTVGV